MNRFELADIEAQIVRRWPDVDLTELGLANLDFNHVRTALNALAATREPLTFDALTARLPQSTTAIPADQRDLGLRKVGELRAEWASRREGRTA